MLHNCYTLITTLIVILYVNPHVSKVYSHLGLALNDFRDFFLDVFRAGLRAGSNHYPLVRPQNY